MSTTAVKQEYQVGDVIQVTYKTGFKGGDQHILEIGDDGTLRTQYGWFDPNEIKGIEVVGHNDVPDESATDESPQTVTTAVDGQDAQIVLDGTIPSPETVMIKPSLDDLVSALVKANADLDKAGIAKKAAADRYKDCQGAQNAVVEQIIEHYGSEDAGE